MSSGSTRCHLHLSRLRSSLLACLLVLLPLSCLHAQITEVGDGGPGPVKAEHLTAELTVPLSADRAPGGTVQTIGLVLTMEEHWHVYWINAGDSGEPPAHNLDAARGRNGWPHAVPTTAACCLLGPTPDGFRLRG